MHQNNETNPAEMMKAAKRMVNLKKYDIAVEKFEDIIAKYPNWLSPYVILYDVLCELGKPEKALKVLLDAKFNIPFNLPIRKKLVEHYLQDGDKESAREVLDSTHLLFPSDNWVRITMEKLRSPFVTKTMAKLYEKQGYKDDAHKIYEKLNKIEEQ